LSLIFVQLDNEDDAYVIFETLNTRGKDLDLTDLVKNHLNKHIRAANRQADKAKLKWKQLLETIEGSTVPLETDTFIHHFWLSKYDYLPAKSLFKKMRKEITAADAKEFLEFLVQDARLYRSIFDVAYGHWTKQESRIAAALQALSLFRVVQPVPCVLSLIREYKTTQKIAKRHVEDALVAVEKFHFLFTAVTSQRSSGGISKMYALHARQLHEAANAHSAAREIAALKQKLKDRVPSKEEFVALFPEVVYTDTLAKQRKLVKYILAGLHAHGAAGPAVDFDKMTIEHLASQSQISDSLSEHVVGQIGNLLLVTEQVNNKLRNRSFADKKKVLRDHGYTLPPEIESATIWGATEITERTQSLAKTAYDAVWKIQ
jgi:hypothetical protein